MSGPVSVTTLEFPILYDSCILNKLIINSSFTYLCFCLLLFKLSERTFQDPILLSPRV